MKKTAILGVAAVCVIASLAWSRGFAGPPESPSPPHPPGGPSWAYPFGPPTPAEMSPDLFDLTPDLIEEPSPPLFGLGLMAGAAWLPPMPPPPVDAFWGCPCGPPAPAEMLPNLLDLAPALTDELGLTDEQLGQMLLIYVDYNDRTRKARTDLADLHVEKEAMMLRGKIDQAKLVKLDQETIELASVVMSEKLKMKREQLSRLRPEQVERFAQFLSTLTSPSRRKEMPR